MKGGMKGGRKYNAVITYTQGMVILGLLDPLDDERELSKWAYALPPGAKWDRVDDVTYFAGAWPQTKLMR